MKKYFIVFLLFIFALSLFSKTISESQAKAVLNNFLEYKNKADYKSSTTILFGKNKTKLAYIYQLSPEGFVVISSDDEITPILAYSFRNNLVTSNDNLIYYMLSKDIQLRLSRGTKQMKMKAQQEWENYLSLIKDNRDFQQWPAPGCTQTDGWVETTWNQTGVYNRFCPLDGPNSRSVVGCVATALSMIIDFHNYVGNVQFSDADDYTTGWDGQMHIDDDHEERDYPSFPELNQYLITLNEHYENNIPLTADDKSALCFAAGIATHMIYGSEGSGTWVSEVQTALLNKFNYSSAIYTDNINSQFYTHLADNMKSMKPAELAIYTEGWNNGHAIICDGYNTDNFFHLNYGWGTSNNTCWYSLPQGMPYNYSILANAVIDIEGGDIPTHVTGNVSTPGTSPQGTYIRLEGEKIYEAYVNSSDGSFEFPAVTSGNYIITAILEGETLYYVEQEITISGNTQTIDLDLAIYDALSITINSPINPFGTHIKIIKNDEIVYETICQNNEGSVSIPNVLPGEYTAFASLGENLFSSQNFEVTSTNQSLTINLTEYPSVFNKGFHFNTAEKWHLINNYPISCGIKLTSDDISIHQDLPLAKIALIPPISSDEGEIYIQLWENNTLLEQKALSNFSEGVWKNATFDNFHILNPEKVYYVGYKIITETGYIAYYDNGPRNFDKGAFLRTTSWNPVPISTLNANFCIEAVFLSLETTSISGTISTSDDYSFLENGIIRAGNYITTANQNGEYTLNLISGTYDITAYLPEHIPATISQIQLNENEQINDIDFVLDYGTQNSTDDIISSPTSCIKAYPNPYNMNKNQKSLITFEINGKISEPLIKIYNIKGQFITVLNTFSNSKAVWNPNDTKIS